MKQKIISFTIFVACFCTCSNFGFNQEKFEIEFDTTMISIISSKETDVILAISVNFETTSNKTWHKQEIIPFINYEHTTIPKRNFEILTQNITLDSCEKSGSKNIFFRIKKDTLHQEGQIYLSLKINDALGKEITDKYAGNKNLIIKVESSVKLKKGYEYLGYIGTNFDLVEGIKAKNFFFATNILSQPRKNTRIGFYLSLYGNRAMTMTDSSRIRSYVTKQQVLTDSTYLSLRDYYRVKNTRSTDNIGAYVSPLIPLGSLSKNSNATQVYYSPSLEFVWRRTVLTSDFSFLKSDSSNMTGSPLNLNPINTPSSTSINLNEYSFNAGIIGFFLIHENDRISVRVHGSVGYTSNFYYDLTQPTGYGEKGVEDIFFSGRAWITEPVTGITLQAEVTNTQKMPRPFYIVTLSKAFTFGELGKFFQPLTSK